jgi:two-component sensor histidine kinase
MDSLVKKLRTQQRALSEFGSFAFRSPDLHTILTRAAVACAAGLDVPLCKVCRYRVAQNDLIIEAGHGWQPNIIGTSVARADGSSPGGHAFVSKRPIICDDLSKTDYVLSPVYAQHSIVSTVNVPISGTNGEVPFGILEIDSDQIRHFDQHDVDFLTGFANVLAEAVGTHQRLAHMARLLDEKDVLSRELQHRVRNNLHLIQNMLLMEAESADGNRDGFRDIANRVQALSVVYDHLLGSGMSRTLALNEYLDELCATLRAFQPATVRLSSQATIPVTVDIDTATSIGLAVCEIITNAYKHAFPDDRQGSIEVKLEGRLVPVIQIVDNGAGFEQSASKRHGLGLVSRLVSQANGTFSITRRPGEPGTQCEIILPKIAANV